MTVVGTYNYTLPHSGIVRIYGELVFFMEGIFGPKSIASVTRDHVTYQTLKEYKYLTEKVIIFAGKKESGSLEIIRLVVEIFVDQKEKLFFPLCDHDIEEKKALLAELGILPTQYMVFTDGHTQCQEAPVLLGYLYQHIHEKKSILAA